MLGVTLDRPESLNAFSPDMYRGITDAIRWAGEDEEIRAVAVRGAGRAFSAGGDLKAERARNADGHKDMQGTLHRYANPMISALRHLPKPVVAVVHGPAVGIGCSLALACDLVVAAESAYFTLAFARVGLALDGGASAFVPTLVGAARAAEMALLAERVTAPEAVAWGLINRACPDASLEDEAAALIARLAEGPTLAFGEIKRELNAWLYPRLDDQLAVEATSQQRAAESADHAEGVAGFKEGRPPRYRGA